MGDVGLKSLHFLLVHQLLDKFLPYAFRLDLDCAFIHFGGGDLNLFWGSQKFLYALKSLVNLFLSLLPLKHPGERQTVMKATYKHNVNKTLPHSVFYSSHVTIFIGNGNSVVNNPHDPTLLKSFILFYFKDPKQQKEHSVPLKIWAKSFIRIDPCF